MFNINARVSAISLVPLLGLIGFSGLSIVNSWDKMNAAQRLRSEVALALAVGEVNHQLQLERGLSTGYLAAKDATADPLQRQREASDQSMVAMTDLLDGEVTNAAGAHVEASVASFREALDGLPQLRTDVAARSGNAAGLAGRYTAVIAVGIDVVGVVERGGTALDADVGRALSTYSALARAKEYAGRERATGMGLLGTEPVAPAGLMRVSALAGEQDAEFAAVRRVMLPQYREGWERFAASPEDKNLAEMRQQLLAAIGAAAPFAPKAWFEAASARMDALRKLQADVAQDADSMAAGVHARARSALIFGAVLAALSTLVALVAAYLAGRSITRPLGVLTNEMNALAAGNKSVAVEAAVRIDEIGEMGRAVLVFKNAAIELEKAQAEHARIEAEAAAERRRNEEERAARAAEQQRVVEDLAAGLSQLSDGDLTTRIQASFAPEYEQLRSDFNLAMGKLHAAIQAVIGSAGGIHSGADEISRAADDQSRRTEQQAASLEETAAALDEITATVRKTAESASRASSVVSGTRAQTEASSQVVREAVAAMGEIDKSSSQISQIIGVINEIAFQTNLLALNAGVEAARAGEAGRGFMVVASEVRALSQRSSEAAKEIKELISASSQHVERGVQLVGQTGEALLQITERVAEIDGLVGDIAAAAQGQATGLAQINTAVNQMDQVTQQNAAMAEETTAASHSLTKEAEEMARLTAHFRTGGAARGYAPSANAHRQPVGTLAAA